MDEGSNWEAIMSAAHFKLDNLVMVIDKNGLQYDGPTENIMNTDSLQRKFEAFCCKTDVVDGHDIDALIEVFHQDSGGCPQAVIAETIKGKGVSFMENVREWHHASLSQKQYEQALEEIRGMRL